MIQLITIIYILTYVVFTMIISSINNHDIMKVDK